MDIETIIRLLNLAVKIVEILLSIFNNVKK